MTRKPPVEPSRLARSETGRRARADQVGRFRIRARSLTHARCARAAGAEDREASAGDPAAEIILAVRVDLALRTDEATCPVEVVAEHPGLAVPDVRDLRLASRGLLDGAGDARLSLPPEDRGHARCRRDARAVGPAQRLRAIAAHVLAAGSLGLEALERVPRAALLEDALRARGRDDADKQEEGERRGEDLLRARHVALRSTHRMVPGQGSCAEIGLLTVDHAGD